MGGNDDYSQQLDDQNRLQMQEIERKKQSLFQTRLDIIKGQGQQSWTPRPLQGSPQDTERPPLSRRGKTAAAERAAWDRAHQGR
jgi:hypothetical protein